MELNNHFSADDLAWSVPDPFLVRSCSVPDPFLIRFLFRSWPGFPVSSRLPPTPAPLLPTVSRFPVGYPVTRVLPAVPHSSSLHPSYRLLTLHFFNIPFYIYLRISRVTTHD